MKKMKDNLKTGIIMVLLTLILALLPVMSWADEEIVPADPKQGDNASTEFKPVEQDQPEDKVTGEVAASVLSAYIWRGQELTRHSVVIQPPLPPLIRLCRQCLGKS
jgi:hypothetical protein